MEKIIFWTIAIFLMIVLSPIYTALWLIKEKVLKW